MKSSVDPVPKESSQEKSKIIKLIEIILLLSLIAFSYAILTHWPSSPKPLSIPGFIESESMQVKGKSSDFQFDIQSTQSFVDGSWTDNNHQVGRPQKPNEWIDLNLSTPETAHYEITAYLSKSFDYGIVKIAINGKDSDQTFDLYSPQVTSTGPLNLGTWPLKAGTNILRIQVVGKNPMNTSDFYNFGVDGFTAVKVEEKK